MCDGKAGVVTANRKRVKQVDVNDAGCIRGLRSPSRMFSSAKAHSERSPIPRWDSFNCFGPIKATQDQYVNCPSGAAGQWPGISISSNPFYYRGTRVMTRTIASQEEIDDSTAATASTEPSTLQGESLHLQEDDNSSFQVTERGTLADRSQESIGAVDAIEGTSEASASTSVNSAASNRDSDAHDDSISDIAIPVSFQSPGEALACPPDEESLNAYCVPCPTSALSSVEDISSDTENVDYSKNTWSCSSLCMDRRRLLVSITAVLLLAVVIIAMIVPLRGNKNVESNSSGNEATPVDEQAIYEMRSYILMRDWSDPLSVLDPTSPQYKAIQQLAFEGAPLDSTLEQRYAILVVWYGLGGEDVSDEHECDWKDLIQCDSLHRVTALTMRERLLEGTISEEIGMLTNLGECTFRYFAAANFAVSFSPLICFKSSWIFITIRFKASFRRVSTILSN